MSFETVLEEIKNEKYKNIIILSGAGVSTNCGIPDYRSSDGIFSQLIKDNEYNLSLPSPSTFLSRAFITEHPDFFETKLMKEFTQKILDAEPSYSHLFAKWLYEKDILKRVYTQNVDSLYQKAGLPEEMIVEFHGNFAKGTAVLYGDSIPQKAFYQVIEDFSDTEIDLIIVMGSSLQVSPFCAIPNLVNKNCTRILVDIKPENAMTNPWSKRRTILDGMYSDGGGISWTKFGRRKVSLRPYWSNKKKYVNQYILRMDCDEFSEYFL